MKQSIFSSAMFFFAILFMTVGCTDDDPITIDSSQPNGSITVERSGAFTAESNTPTTGTAELGTDEDGTNFLSFTSDFKTELATGTVSIYFSTSSVFTADPGNGNPDLKLVGSVKSNGAQSIKLDAAIPSSFTHVILWCNTAGVPFGNAELN